MLIGLASAALILGAWGAIHVGFIFLGWSGPVALVVLAQAWLSAGLFIVAHDCMHGSFAPGRPRINRVMGALCVGLYACFSYEHLRRNHFRHHGDPGTADDPDFNPDDPRGFLRWYLRFFRHYYTHGQLLRITLAASAYMLLGAKLADIALFWAVPALLSSLQLFTFGTWLPHRHGEAPFADRHNARSGDWGWLGSLLTCFHFGGYHHEHHLKPHLPWWRLPQASDGMPKRAR